MANILRSVLATGDGDLFNTIMATAPFTAVVVDSEHIIVRIFGEKLLPALGYSWPDELIGQPVETLVPPPLRKSHETWFNGWLNDPQDRPLRQAELMSVWTKQGGTTQVRITLGKLYLPDGEAIGEKYAGKPFRGGIAYVVTDI